jgi:hypothetical protein
MTLTPHGQDNQSAGGVRIPATSTESIPGRPEHGATGYPYLVTGGEKKGTWREVTENDLSIKK